MEEINTQIRNTYFPKILDNKTTNLSAKRQPKNSSVEKIWNNGHGEGDPQRACPPLLGVYGDLFQLFPLFSSWSLHWTDQKADIFTQVGTLVAAAGVLGEVACPSAQGEFLPFLISRLLSFPFFLSVECENKKFLWPPPLEDCPTQLTLIFIFWYLYLSVE